MAIPIWNFSEGWALIEQSTASKFDRGVVLCLYAHSFFSVYTMAHGGSATLRFLASQSFMLNIFFSIWFAKRSAKKGTAGNRKRPKGMKSPPT